MKTCKHCNSQNFALELVTIDCIDHPEDIGEAMKEFLNNNPQEPICIGMAKVICQECGCYEYTRMFTDGSARLESLARQMGFRG